MGASVRSITTTTGHPFVSGSIVWTNPGLDDTIIGTLSIPMHSLDLTTKIPKRSIKNWRNIWIAMEIQSHLPCPFDWGYLYDNDLEAGYLAQSRYPFYIQPQHHRVRHAKCRSILDSGISTSAAIQDRRLIGNSDERKKKPGYRHDRTEKQRFGGKEKACVPNSKRDVLCKKPSGRIRRPLHQKRRNLYHPRSDGNGFWKVHPFSKEEPVYFLSSGRKTKTGTVLQLRPT